MPEKIDVPLDGETLARIILEHFRNVVVAVLFLTAGFWLQKHVRDGWWGYWDSFSSFLLWPQEPVSWASIRTISTFSCACGNGRGGSIRASRFCIWPW